jgi:hypothetical protein
MRAWLSCTVCGGVPVKWGLWRGSLISCVPLHTQPCLLFPGNSRPGYFSSLPPSKADKLLHQHRDLLLALSKIMASGQDEVPATPRVEPLDKLTYIQEWRNRSNHTQYAPGPIQLTVIKDLYSMTIDLWRKVLLASRSSGSQHKPHNMTDDSFQTLHLWGMGHGVLDGDLDSCLQSSKELYDSVMSLLVSIAELLFYGQRLSLFS